MPATDRALDALGNPVRRQIVEMLALRPQAVGEIAAQLPISRPAVSKHLRVLQGAALVEFTPDGTRNVFALRRAGFDTAREWLGDFWDDALARFRMVAENLPDPHQPAKSAPDPYRPAESTDPEAQDE